MPRARVSKASRQKSRPAPRRPVAAVKAKSVANAPKSKNGAGLLPELSAAEKLTLYRQMLLIRRFEEKAGQAFQQAKIKGFCHLYIGQEAVAVGTISVLRPEDAVITAYRDHGHALARGMTSTECMAELFGKVTGCSKGKGGSMHFFSKDKHFYGGHGIVGGQTPLAAGLAFAQKYQGSGGITLCYLGDGAVNQGAFHEALNLVALWGLPIIYVIENNEYAMGTSVARSSAGLPLTNRAAAYGMEAVTVNGMDLDEVREKTAAAVHRVRTESRPILMEIRTYRYRGHSMSDPGNYRSKEEIEKRRQQDPIERYAHVLLQSKAATQAKLDALDADVVAEVDHAITFAEESPEPNPSEIFDDVFAPEDQIEEIPRQGNS